MLVAPAVVPVDDAEARRSSRGKSVRASGENSGAAYGAFRNCAAARAADAAPVYRRHPGFGPHLDAFRYAIHEYVASFEEVFWRAVREGPCYGR